MSTYTTLFKEMPLWRKVATVVLLAVAVVLWIVIVVGAVETTPAIFGVIALALVAGLVGPRSPIFR